MINTYNESSLHKTLKNMLCKENKGKTEVQVESYICDIVTNKNTIIEIQTKNLGNLNGKILNLLESYKVCLVYPLAVTTYIEYYNEEKIDSKPISRRKSPNKKNIYTIFDELMGCFPLLLHRNFCLKVIEVSVTKERVKTNRKVQSTNRKRRFLKDWLSHDSTLDEIFDSFVFKSKKDYLNLLPHSLSKTFTVSDIITSKNLVNITKQQAYKMVWTFNKMGIIEYIGKEGRNKVYRISGN